MHFKYANRLKIEVIKRKQKKNLKADEKRRT